MENLFYIYLDFLKKHIRTKHIELASDRLNSVSIPYMRKRYESEDILTRPLPMVPLELSDGGFETRSVRDILERCHRLPRMSSAGRGGFGGRGARGGRGGGRGRSDMGDRRWSGGGGGRGGGGFNQMGGGGGYRGSRGGGDGYFNDRRMSAPSNYRNDQRDSNGGGGGGGRDDMYNRPIISYVDVDAPEVYIIDNNKH